MHCLLREINCREVAEYWGRIENKNFMYHRLKGPALHIANIRGEVIQSWYVNGIEYEKREDFLDLIFNDKKQSHPQIIWNNGTKEWHKRISFCDCRPLNRLDDSPAVEYSNGDKEWWVDGKRHRENGPAVIIGNKQYWFENGEFQKCII